MVSPGFDMTWGTLSPLDRESKLRMLFMIMAMADRPEDRRKVEQLYEKYNRLMYVVAFRILNHHEDAEDAVIHAWEKIIQHLDKISEIDCHETKSFIVIVVERVAIDHYRKNKRRNKVEAVLDEYEQTPYFVTRDYELEKAELHDFFRGLAKIYSDVLILYYVNGFSGKEIAELLGLKEDTVMQRLRRGRLQLKREMGLDE